jgi:hypothetical protein
MVYQRVRTSFSVQQWLGLEYARLALALRRSLRKQVASCYTIDSALSPRARVEGKGAEAGAGVWGSRGRLDGGGMTSHTQQVSQIACDMANSKEGTALNRGVSVACPSIPFIKPKKRPKSHFEW